MPRRATRLHHRLRPSALVLMPCLVVAGLAGLAGLAGATVAASASPLLGDPDIPALGSESAAASRSFLRHDLDRLTSPQSLHRLLAGGTLALAVHGEESPDRMEALLDRPSLDGGVDVGNTYGHGAVLVGGALACFAAGAVTGDANLRGTGGEMARALAYTSLTVTAIKLGVDRTRPSGGGWSFPSGHTAAAFAVAPVLSRRFGRFAAIPAYVLAVGTGLGRMEERKHYLSDVIAGAAIGLTIGRAVAGDDTDDRHANAAGPEFGVGPGGAQVTVHF